jgi:hypothetical protein
MNPSSSPGWKAKYAWSEIDRAEPPKRPATDRVSDFRQTHLPYDEATARAQASRCKFGGLDSSGCRHAH